MTNSTRLFEKLAKENKSTREQAALETQVSIAKRRTKYFAEKLALKWHPDRIINEWTKLERQ